MSGLRAWLLDPVPRSRAQAWWLASRAFRANPIAMVGLGLVLLLLLTALFAPWIAGRSPIEQDLANRLAPPSAAHWLGTDELGRDIWARIVWGSRITLTIVGIVVVIVGPLGLQVGTVAGYPGGWVDTLPMRLTDRLPAADPGARAGRRARPRDRERDPRDRGHRLAALSKAGAGRDLGYPQERLHRRGDRPGCLDAADPPGPGRALVPLFGDRPADPRHGRDHLDRRRPRLSRPRRPAAGPRLEAMIASDRQCVLDLWWVAGMPGAAIFLVSLGFNLSGDGPRDVLDPKRGRG